MTLSHLTMVMFSGTLISLFFDEIIICFDGDESGYKAALRAAENSIKDLKPEKQISFLFLPDKEDPDSFVNKNGKEFFIDFSKQSKVSMHQFIFNHYKFFIKLMIFPYLGISYP